MSYKLVWQDLFDVDGTPNKDIWSYETGGHGFGNNESQYYTDSLKNAYVKDNILNIVAYKEKHGDNDYTSAKLITYNKKSIKYGKVVVEAKLPRGLGTWPAIWFLSDSFKEGASWPFCGEIDLMEHVGKDPDNVHFSLHSKLYNHIIHTQETHIMNSDKIFDEFCSYEMRWDEESIGFYFNGEHKVTFNKKENDEEEGWPFDQDYYLILNLAIGGWWGGEIDDSMFPVNFQISSVKVYEKS